MGLLTDAITTAVNTWRALWGEALKLFLAQPVSIGLETLLDVLGKRMSPKLKPLIETLEATGEVPPELQPLFDEIKAPSGEIGALLSYASARGGLGLVTGGFLATLTSGLDNALKATIQPSLLDVRSIIDAERRKAATDFFANQEWLWTGFNTTRREILREVTRPLPTLEDLRQIYLRFPHLHPQVDKTLESYGFTEANIGNLKLIWKVIPGPGDQVRFAVREAFDPAAISKYNLGAFYPKLFEENVARVGLDPEWALRYWYSHWELPSTLQGFEMLHRGVIDKETLLDLMRYADILPWWHEKLIAIAYRPYTRVDVRRMEAADVLDRAAVKRSYLDLGFDDDKAENMTEFTIRWNQAANRDLSKTDITDGYKRGLLARGEAVEDLVALGYDEDEIGFYLDREDFKKDQALLDDYSARYKKLYVKNLIDEATLRTELGAVGATTAQITELIRLWDIEKLSQKETVFEEKERDLTRANVTDGYRKGLFTREETSDLLDRLGYDTDEIGFYLTREDYRREEDRAKDIQGVLRKQYLKGLIDDSALETALADVPLPPEEISHSLSLWRLEKETEEWTPIAATERDLTKSDVLDAYRKRIIPRDQAGSMLQTLGYDPDETELLITKTDYLGEKDKRDLSLSIYRQLYTTGILDKTSTTAALADLGFAEEAIELLYELWDVEREGGARVPTKAELTRFLKKGIINDATWRTQLAMMGYSDRYIGWYQEDMRE